MLLDLSAELLEVIGAELTHTDYAVLRQVCKDLNGAVYRFFFSDLVLKISGNGPSEVGVQKLKTLAAGATGWSLYATTLRIVPAKAGGEGDHGGKLIDLAAALATLSNIQTVVWHVHDQVVSSLRKFTLKISGQGPSWGRQALTPEMYQDFIQLVTVQSQLSSLHLEGPTELSPVWRILRSRTQHTIKPTEITTNVVTHELFDYLSSYSGLEKLTLKYPDGGNANESNRLADAFFATVLPRHAEFLTELSCPAVYESRFSFGTHDVNVVSLLRKLTRLEMSINAGAVRRVQNQETYVDGKGRVHRMISIGISVEADQADIDPVTLLLETAACFPTLQCLTIVSAETESNRGAWCGNGRIHHKGTVDTAIATAVVAFRTDVPCSAIIRTGYNIYELRPLWEEGRLGYEQTGRY
ncbi:hypothetical protein MSAN_01587000 [Mycena sanguinolenta]|uniref:F-box domain-containing protein n=1 Tax=Mycena sanguinolenta TaxID=230812 RepID=A0A8H6Y4I8_9AGAR|nr:hypothetical protein MSAN_01587000 [Mycena sanguinolenta]